MAESSSLYVAHEADLNTLKEHWQAAREGRPQVVHITAPIGGGKRALVGELCRSATVEEPDVIIWRPALTDEEDGMQTLLRMFAGLFAGLHRSPTLRGKVEMTLNSQLPKQPPRVQRWYQAFIEGLKKGAPKPGEDKFQVILPRDNPLIGLVEIAIGISRAFPIILDVQNLQNAQSLSLAAMLEGMVRESAGHPDEASRLLLLLSSIPFDDTAKAWISVPLQQFFERCEGHIQGLPMTPWSEEDVQKYLTSKAIEADAARLAELTAGRPGFVAEMVDWLTENDRLGDLSTLTMATLADVTADEDELEEPDQPAAEGQRRHATAEDAEKIAYLAALLGLSFPSSLVADMGAFTRDSIDDILDATEDIYKELQFSQPLGTWIYQFKKALLRESVLARHQSDEDKQVAQRVGAFMERFLVPRGYAYLVKTLRIYAESGAKEGANRLRSAALATDQPQVWAMTLDLLRYFDEVSWPDPMWRTVYMNLLDRMVAGGDVNQTEGLYNESMKWATEKEDRAMQAWLLLAGSRLDLRRKDLYRARDRANDALKLYRSLGSDLKQAEVLIHIGMIELNDGNTNAARDRASEAIEIANVPPIQSHYHFIRGLVAKRARQLNEASEQFKRANELAGQAGQGPLALEAGLNLGEVMLISGQHSKAADVLARVVQIAQALNNPTRERAATSLLGQARAALKQFEGAIQAATRTLELTRQLKFNRLEAVDIYNLGLFHLMNNSPTEAVSLFRQARQKADASNAGFMKELLFNMGSALAQIGEKSAAEETLRESLPKAQQAKDWRKVIGANQMLARFAAERGDKNGARTLLQAALKAADAGNLKEERKGIRRQLESL
ncbi:MAG: tetratricopeptide repeat protein [Myxococcota bacterium]